MIEPQHRRSAKGLSLGLVALTLALGVRAMADDWPQFLGPTRTGVYNGPALSETWGPTGPRLLWRRHVGQGLSGPVVAQNRVILHLWTATEDGASYSSGAAATIAGRRFAIFLTRNGLVGLDPATGQVRSQRKRRARQAASVNVATPVVQGDLMFVSAEYGPGAGVLRFDGSALTDVWSSDDVLSNHYAESPARARAALLPVGPDARVPMRQVYEMLRGTLTPDEVLSAAGTGPREQFYGHLYVGLYFEALGMKDRAREHILMAAAERFQLGGYMHTVARVHARSLAVD